jgi:thiol-disulfide isomerase/thioredoxin
MIRGAVAVPASALLALLLAGCVQEPPRTDEVRGDPKEQSAPKANQPSGAAQPVKLQVVSLPEWETVLAAHRGKIVVVDNWATWCPPCRAEFPEMVKLHHDYAGKAIVCMSVSLDQPADQAKALAFLQEKGAAFPNFLIDDLEAWADKWNIKGIPVVLVFDRSGKLLRKFDRDDPDKQFTYADVEKYVAELVGQP